MKALVYRLVYPLFQLYWFIFRPKTQGVTCLIIDETDILLVQHTYISGYWSLPGGGLKKGEDTKNAVRREILEELGLTIQPEYLGSFITTAQYKVDTVYCFVAYVKRGSFVIDHAEIIKAQWWDMNTIPRNRLIGIDRVLALYREKPTP